jgi:hypothetical protein
MKRRDQLGDPGVDERIILIRLLGKYGSREWTVFI